MEHWPFHIRHHHHRRHDDDDYQPPLWRITVALTLSVGQTDTLTAVADDVSGAVDPNAVITFASDDAGAFITLVDNGGGSAAVAAVAVGTANVTATATDPDGSTAHSDPFAVTVTAPVVS